MFRLWQLNGQHWQFIAMRTTARSIHGVLEFLQERDRRIGEQHRYRIIERTKDVVSFQESGK
jgi:hypothetical protein